jgi:SAM-dependent methyltransferase
MKDWDENEESQNAVEAFNLAAQRYADWYMDVSNYAHALDAFLTELPQDSPQVLELACGPGNVSRHLLDQRPDMCLLATDLAPEMLKIAQKVVPEAELLSLDMREMRHLGRQFDGVVNAFGSPYLRKDALLRWLQDLPSVLRPGGLLFLSTMEGPHSSSELQTNSLGSQVMVYFHEAEYILSALEAAGFALLQTFRQPFSHRSGYQYQDLLLIAKLNR